MDRLKSVILLMLVALTGCQREFIPEITTNPNQIVVEGYIEAGDNAAPAYVILTKSIPFFQQFNIAEDFFIKGAEVYVNNGKDSVRLTQICWKDLDSATQKVAASLFGINIDSVTKQFNFCVYADIGQKIKG